MHSRIFQVSEKPITKENFIHESKYDDWNEMDYVVTSENITEDIKWLKDVIKGIEINIEEKSLIITSKKEYFKAKFENFKETLEKLRNISLEEFINNKKQFDILDLQTSYEEKYEFYMDDNFEYTGLTPLDNWVRNSEENKKYYIGQTFDYHF